MRLGVRLDPALVLERAILRRISTMTGKRGEDWLRGLVGLGFLTEGRWLRIEGSDVSGRFAPSNARAFSNSYAQYLERTRGEKTTRNLPAPVTPPAAGSRRAAGAAAAPELASLSRVQAPASAATVRSGSKPLAHLARVIG